MLSGILFYSIIVSTKNGLIGHIGAFLLGTILSILLSLVLIALTVMNADDLPRLGRLFRSALFSSIGWGLGLCVVPIALVRGLLKMEWIDPFRVWIELQAPYVYATVGPVMLFAILPAMFVAWPIRARHDTGLMASVYYVWRNLEDTRYNPMEMTALTALVGGVMIFLPVIALFAPALIVQVAAAAFAIFKHSIVVHDD